VHMWQIGNYVIYGRAYICYDSELNRRVLWSIEEPSDRKWTDKIGSICFDLIFKLEFSKRSHPFELNQTIQERISESCDRITILDDFIASMVSLSTVQAFTRLFWCYETDWQLCYLWFRYQQYKHLHMVLFRH
jgi:hypothetical protein